nr:MAG TPA: tail protein [Caudoviricetes sp.]
MITLHYNDKTKDVQESDSSYRYRALMAKPQLVLKFSLTEYIEFPIGTWCEYMGEKYRLHKAQDIKKNGVRNIEYTLNMGGDEDKLADYKFRNSVDHRLKWSMCAKPREFVEEIVKNLNEREGADVWSVGDCLDAKEKTVEFNHAYIDAALQDVAEAFKTEWKIVNHVISLHKVEYFKDSPLPLSYGKGKGFIPGVGRTTASNEQPIKRLYVQGGDKNIDRSKYGSAELLLPKGQTLEYDGRTYRTDDKGIYVERVDKVSDAVKEDSLDCSEIYPSRVGKVTAVNVINKQKNFYDIVDSTIPDSLDYNKYIIAGENMTIVFQSGMLAGTGKEFELKYKHADKRFELVPQEIDGVTMPNETFKPQVGDMYAIFGCMLPDAYVCDNATKSGASWDMLREAARHLREHEDPKFTFTGTLQGLYAKRNWVNVGGYLKVGGYIRFSDTQFAKDGVDIRITGIKDFLTNPYSPTIEISNTVSVQGIGSQLREIDSQEVALADTKREIVQYTKRRFRDAKETMELLERSLLEGFTDKVTPIAIRTMQMLVGDESLQFRFVNNRTNPTAVSPNITYNGTSKQLSVNARLIQHLTLGIKSISPQHKPIEYRYWALSEYISARLDNTSTPYYLYVKAERNGLNATFTLSERAIRMEEDNSYYHFLVGVLNSEHEGDRSFTTLYGYTEVLPGRITTDKIVSGDGNSYFDMLSDALKLGDKLQYNVNGDGQLKIRGTIVQSQSGDEAPIGCFRGDYNVANTYYNGDEVTYIVDGNYSTYRYIHTSPSKGHLPTEFEYWAVIAQGQRGKNGKGVEYIYQRTDFEVVPATPASQNTSGHVPSGWTDNPLGVMAEYPFEYVCTRKQGDNGVWGNWSTPKLWAVLPQSNENLLEQSEFEGASKMGKWTATKGEDNIAKGKGKDGTNAYVETNDKRYSESPYRDVLQQTLVGNGIAKLQPSTWYTLSFWERSGTRRLDINQTSSAYGFAEQKLYLFFKQKYTLQVNGRIDARAKADGKVLAVFLYNKDWTWQKAIQIDTTEDKTVELEFSDVPRDGEYLMAAFLYNDSAPRDGKSTLNWVRLVNQSWCMQSFVYPSAVDNSLVVTDGKERRDVGGDLSVTYAPNDTDRWRRHVVTFKTKDALPADTEQYALIRLLPSPITGQKNYCEICMPKLEAGKVASTYTRNITDVAADIPTPALVFRGEYDASKTYYGNRYRVDACKFGNAYYVCRNDAGEVKGIEPTNTSKWNSFGASFDSVATGLLLAENAEIAGWVFRDGKLYSQNGKAYLDGVTGDVDIQGKFLGTIDATSGKFKKLICVGNAGEEAGSIEFYTSGSIGINGGLRVYNNFGCDGDILHNGQKNGRTLRFYSGDILCRGSFGASSRVTAIVVGDKISILTMGDKYTTIKGTLCRIRKRSQHGERDVLCIPLYVANGYGVYNIHGTSMQWGTNELNGLHIDTVIIKDTEATTIYCLDGDLGKVVHVLSQSERLEIDNGVTKLEYGKITVDKTYILPKGKMATFACIAKEYKANPLYRYSEEWICDL